MRYIFVLIILIFIFSGCSVKNKNIKIEKSTQNKKIEKLFLQIQSLSNTVNKKEAKSLSEEAVKYSKKLSQEYKVTTPALFHNTLINMNIKSRGFCYHYANDLLKYLRNKHYKSFMFKKVISNRDDYFEHSSIIVTTNKTPFKESIILDAWRDTGDLYFSKIKDDKRYKWEIK